MSAAHLLHSLIYKALHCFNTFKKLILATAKEFCFLGFYAIHVQLNGSLEGDIKGYFDNISHDWLLKNVPIDKRILYQ